LAQQGENDMEAICHGVLGILVSCLGVCIWLSLWLTKQESSNARMISVFGGNAGVMFGVGLMDYAGLIKLGEWGDVYTILSILVSMGGILYFARKERVANQVKGTKTKDESEPLRVPNR